MLHEKESCTHIMHIPQNILNLIDKTLYEKESHTHMCKFRSDCFKIRLIKCSMTRKNQALTYALFTETYLPQKYCQVLHHEDQSSTHMCRTI